MNAHLAGTDPQAPSLRGPVSLQDSPQFSPTAGVATDAGRVSAKVAALRIRRSGSQCYADLPCLECDSFGYVTLNANVPHSASIDPPEGDEIECPACHAARFVTMESTLPDFVRFWNEATYPLTEAERDEANAILCGLEDEANESAFQASRRVAAR